MFAHMFNSLPSTKKNFSKSPLMLNRDTFVTCARTLSHTHKHTNTTHTCVIVIDKRYETCIFVSLLVQCRDKTKILSLYRACFYIHRKPRFNQVGRSIARFVRSLARRSLCCVSFCFAASHSLSLTLFTHSLDNGKMEKKNHQ